MKPTAVLLVLLTLVGCASTALHCRSFTPVNSPAARASAPPQGAPR